MDLSNLLYGFVKVVTWICQTGQMFFLGEMCLWQYFHPCLVYSDLVQSSLVHLSPCPGCIIGSHRQQQDRALIDRYNQPRQAGPTGPLYKGSIQHGKYRFIISKDLGQTKMSLFCRYCDHSIRLLSFFLVSKISFYENCLFCPL